MFTSSPIAWKRTWASGFRNRHSDCQIFARDFDIEPKVAMVSFSKLGASNHSAARKVRQAVNIVRERRPDILIDGGLQADVAISGEIAKRRYPFSQVTGANVLVFPNLDASLAAFKVVSQFRRRRSYRTRSPGTGPICPCSPASDGSPIDCLDGSNGCRRGAGARAIDGRRPEGDPEGDLPKANPYRAVITNLESQSRVGGAFSNSGWPSVISHSMNDGARDGIQDRSDKRCSESVHGKSGHWPSARANRAALITRTNNPKVISVIGRVSRTNIGRRKALISPITSAATSATPKVA